MPVTVVVMLAASLWREADRTIAPLHAEDDVGFKVTPFE